MSATETTTPIDPRGLPAAALTRILDEGYGPGAWYGSDLRAAIAGGRVADFAAKFTQDQDKSC